MKRKLIVFLICAISLVFAACEGDDGGDSGNDTAATYSVTYDGNGSTGGDVPADSTRYKQGQSVTVKGNTGNLVRAGLNFAGWCVNANGEGDSYTGEQTFIMGSANVTLYAKWTANPTYTVTYNGNGSTGGNVPGDSTHYEQGQN